MIRLLQRPIAECRLVCLPKQFRTYPYGYVDLHPPISSICNAFRIDRSICTASPEVSGSSAESLSCTQAISDRSSITNLTWKRNQ